MFRDRREVTFGSSKNSNTIPSNYRINDGCLNACQLEEKVLEKHLTTLIIISQLIIT